MSNLIYKADANTTYEFRTDGTFVQTKNGTAANGSWTGVASAATPTGSLNAFRYSLDNKTWQSIPVTYAFVTNPTQHIANILQVTAKNADGSSSSGTYPGLLSASDAHDVTVAVYDNGKAGTLKINVYGELSLPAPFSSFNITLDGGGTTSLSGDIDSQPSNAPANGSGDLLQFEVISQYTSTDPAGSAQTIQSTLQFFGAWNFQNNQLCFTGAVDVANGRVSPNFAFNTEIGATEVGLVVYTDNESTSVAFTIGGQFGTPNGPHGNWTLSVGYSGHQAVVTFNDKITNTGVGDDGTLQVTGTATLSSNSSKINASVNLTYSAKVGTGGVFQLTATASDNAGAYTLSLQGTYKGDNNSLSFSFGYNSSSQQMSVQFNYSAGNLKFALSIIEGASGVSIEASFNVQASLGADGKWHLTPVTGQG
jgi:hypothetical protein